MSYPINEKNIKEFESYICNDVDKTVEYDISMAEKTGAITIVIPNEGPGDT